MHVLKKKKKLACHRKDKKCSTKYNTLLLDKFGIVEFNLRCYTNKKWKKFGGKSHY